MDHEALDQVLADLRAFQTDHQAVEAKRARRSLPETAWQSLSAFANSQGGTLLLGVDEGEGVFEVTGVEEPDRVVSALQSACAELEPPLRPVISLIQHDEGVVVAAEVPALPRDQRPCHRRTLGPHEGSYIRVGDADQKLSGAEVTELLASQSPHDHSVRPAPEGSALEDAEVKDFAAGLRNRYERHEERSDDDLLETYNAVVDGGPSLASLLALGKDPAAKSAAARVAYRRQEGGTARYEANHFEGRVGQLMDQILAQLEKDLRTVQVERDGRVYDELELPLIALREVVGNALLHRSFSATQETASVGVEVSPQAVEITSPGGLHGATDISELGLAPLSGLRNLTLVRICEQLSTPGGARIVENQASGIAAADVACRRLGTMPILFVDSPASFKVVLLRGLLDTEAASRRLAKTALADDAPATRLLAVAARLAQDAEETAGSHVRSIYLDARLAARALAPMRAEDSAALLARMEDAGILTRRRVGATPLWVLSGSDARAGSKSPSSAPSKGTSKKTRSRDRLNTLLMAIAESGGGELSRSDIGRALGLRSTKSASQWINKALEDDLIESTTESAYDPGRMYRLASRGQGRAAALKTEPPSKPDQDKTQ